MAVSKSIKKAVTGPLRCAWARNELAIRYHDQEWGVPVHDDRRLFELLVLEGAQAGLSWDTILKKRDNYRSAFDEFDAERIARYPQRKISRLLADPGIVRNRLKIASASRTRARF
jgi:DNA-3-methyladenine glycosylase I